MRPSALTPATLGSVALGGLLGSAARLVVMQVLGSIGSPFPAATFGVNVVGSALLGGFVASREGETRESSMVGFVAVGLLGSFTTFSAFTREVEHMLEVSMPLHALGYVSASLVGGVLAAAGGHRLVRALK